MAKGREDEGFVFSRWLSRLRQGKLDEDAGEALRGVIREVERTGKGGEVTVKLTVTQASRGELMIKAEVTSKEPKPVVMADLFWVGPGAAPSTRRPGQLSIEDLERERGEEDEADAVDERGIR